MKKLILIITATIMASTAWAQSQQLQTVKGKTKDGKSIKVQYYKGTAQDYIESVKYQKVDELEADNKKKQSNINDLQSQLNKANKQIEQLKAQLQQSGKADQSAELQKKLDQKQNKIDELSEQIVDLNDLLSKKEAENAKLKRQLDSIERVNLQLSQARGRDKHPVIGVEAGMGSVFLSSKSLSTPWEKELSWNKQAAVYYGTDRLAEGFPFSLEFGIGFRSLPMRATLGEYDDNFFIADCDNDMYRPIFQDCSEKLIMNCFEVPVRLCYGQPDKDKVSGYMKLGVTPSYIFSSNLANSTYTRKGYYPAWNVTFEDVEELEFVTVNEGKNEVMPEEGKKFSLWGNAAFGAYFPLSSSLLFNVGAKLDYPIMKIGSFNTTDDKLLLPDDLTKYNGRMFISSLQAGLVYRVK